MRSPKPEYEQFIFEIVGTEFHYSFGGGSRFQVTAHEEHLQPAVNAICQFPARLAGRETCFTLIGDRALDRDMREQLLAPPSESGVGTLTMRGATSNFLGGIPFDAAWSLPSLVKDGCIKFILCNGKAMSRGVSRIRTISFYQHVDLDDF